MDAEHQYMLFAILWAIYANTSESALMRILGNICALGYLALSIAEAMS